MTAPMTIPDEAVLAAIDVYENPSNNCLTYNNMHAALTAALPFLQGVKVKDLRWKGPDSSGEHHALNGLWGYIIRCGNGNGYWLTEIGQYYPTPEAAKAAAQADYEARIRSAIEPAPSPREKALEALFDAVTLMQKHDEKFEGEIPLTTIQKVYAAHTAAIRALPASTGAEATRLNGGGDGH